MARKKVLVIGGSGFIGAHLCRALCDSHIVSVFSRNVDKIRKLEFSRKLELIKGDVSDYKKIEKNVEGKDFIINLASVVSHDSNFDPYMDLEVNCKGQLNVLEARKKVNPHSRYLFVGSRAQFGIVSRKDLPINEDYCQKPVSLYGVHKQAAENYCYLYKRAFDLDSIIIRVPQIYGPSLTNDGTFSIVEKFVGKALKNEEFRVNGYGKDIKDFVYIDDLIELIITILNSDVKEGTFNVGSGAKVQLMDVAKKIVRLCQSGRYKAVPFPKDIEKFELGSFYFDISKVSGQFKWKPKTSLDEGIKKTIMAHKKQFE